MHTLEESRRLIVSQAIMKNWSNDPKWLDKKLEEELKELDEALADNDIIKSSKELIDVWYVLVQKFHNIDPHHTASLDTAFKDIYQSNWKNKKKTIDENGNPILR